MPSKTVADIVREIRAAAYIQNADTPESVIAFAARIEAAAKRERATLEDALSHCREYAEKIERENEEGETRLDAEEIIATVDNEFAGIRPERAPGNAAALREALERAIDAIQAMVVLYDEEHTAAVKTGATWGRSDISAINAIVEQARVALSAPARNCDAIPADEMSRAFKHANCDQYENSSEDPRTCCEGRCVECIVKWMLKEHKEGDEEE